MTLSETLIIYLSLGAPVGVYFLQRESTSFDVHRFLRVVLAFALWPAALIGIIVRGDGARSGTRLSASHDTTHDHLIQTIFELAKRDLGHIGRGQETAQFREMIERYAGLLGSQTCETGGDVVMEFCTAAGHPNPELAAACHLRRLAAKLDIHARAVSAEMREFFGRSQISDELRTGLATLADLLGDHATVEMLFARSGGYVDADGQLPIARTPARAA